MESAALRRERGYRRQILQAGTPEGIEADVVAENAGEEVRFVTRAVFRVFGKIVGAGFD